MSTTFKDLDFTPTENPLGGLRARVFFPNGYGASVVRHMYSYGGNEGFWELAVLEGDNTKSKLTYDTPITDDVIGYLTEEKVTELLQQIEALNPFNVNKMEKEDD